VPQITVLDACLMLLCGTVLDDNLTGQVMNAIVACTEPKLSSEPLLKKYVMEYHPNFKVAEQPLAFEKALQRAIEKDIIVYV
jgi:hypothetical protein